MNAQKAITKMVLGLITTRREYHFAEGTLITETRMEAHELRTYIRAETKSLLATRGFLDALPGYLLPDAASQSRIGIVLERFKELASI